MAKERGRAGAEDAWLGAFVLRSQPGQVETLLPYRDEFGGERGGLSRGILAAFADLARAEAFAAGHAGARVLRFTDLASVGPTATPPGIP